MRIAVAMALMIAGVVMAIFGISSADSFSSELSEFFTGSPTDKAMWLMIGGVAALVAGLVMAVGMRMPRTR